jgi:hypothetical protein
LVHFNKPIIIHDLEIMNIADWPQGNFKNRGIKRFKMVILTKLFFANKLIMYYI